MAIDIPNILTLAIELSVAFLIVLVDQRSRKRDRDAQKRALELDQNHRQAQQLQMERFSGWIEEDSKRQLMMLESIMVSLDTDKAKVFHNEVGQRYTDEISKDLDDLGDLLDRQEKMGIAKDPVLESDINQKIDELSSAQQIAGSFLPKDFGESIKSISQAAKEAFLHIGDISDLQNMHIEHDDDENIKIEMSEEKVNQFKEDREKLNAEIDALKAEIGKSIVDSTSQVTEKLSNIFDSSKFEKGIKDFVSKIGSKKDKSKEDQIDE